VVGSVNLINESVRHDVERFVFTSSIAVYGPNQLPMTEELVPQPEDPYGIAKYSIELDLHAAYEMFGLKYTIFRPHNVYGEHQNIGDKYRNVLGIFMNQIMNDEPLTIFGDGAQTRAFSYIDDVAPTIARSVNFEAAACEVYNIGADKPCTVNELAHVIAAAFGAEPNIRYLPARKEVLHAYASHEKVRSVFGSSDPVPLEVGVGKMAAWARAKGPRTSSAFEGVELEKNLPASWEAVVQSDR
jgi:UDP-glucose 4-epimerase